MHSHFATMSQLPWCIIGDFNDILSDSDKNGRVAHPQWLLIGFREAILYCNLTDIPLEGYPFTWSRSMGSEAMVEERLDGAFISSQWGVLFLAARLMTLIAPISYHSPILLDSNGHSDLLRCRVF